MVTAYKNVEKVTDMLQRQWSVAQKENEEAQLKAAQERLLTDDMAGIPHFPDKELLDQLRAKERDVDNITQRAKLVEGNFKKLQERCEMVKVYVGNFINKKNDNPYNERTRCTKYGR